MRFYIVGLLLSIPGTLWAWQYRQVRRWVYAFWAVITGESMLWLYEVPRELPALQSFGGLLCLIGFALLFNKVIRG